MAMRDVILLMFVAMVLSATPRAADARKQLIAHRGAS
jgi:hypothetical protein